jgi:hypothetical protein
MPIKLNLKHQQIILKRLSFIEGAKKKACIPNPTLEVDA